MNKSFCMPIRFLFPAAMFLALLAGCGTESQTGPSPSTEPDRIATLSHFVILDQNGKNQSQKFSDFDSKNPLGVILSFPATGGDVSQCTISHLTPGLILTNAHCVGGSRMQLRDLVIVYFSNKTGKQVTASVTQVLYQGSLRSDDVALLRISEATAQDFDAVSEVSELAKRIRVWPHPGTVVPDPQVATLYSLDPFVNASSRLSGARVSPKQCLVSRSTPRIARKNKRGVVSEVRDLPPDDAKKIDPAIHVFLDNCNSSPIRGNSGALIVAKSEGVRPSQLIGTFHWILAKSYFNELGVPFNAFLGNDRDLGNESDSHWRTFDGERGEESALSIGTALDALLFHSPFADKIY